jgi:hypothetical protein
MHPSEAIRTERAGASPDDVRPFARVDAADAVVVVVGQVHADLQPETHEQRRDESPGHEHPGGRGPDHDGGDARAERPRAGTLHPDGEAGHGRFGNRLKSGSRLSTNASRPSCASSVM